jgi:hypothetical protein
LNKQFADFGGEVLTGNKKFIGKPGKTYSNLNWQEVWVSETCIYLTRLCWLNKYGDYKPNLTFFWVNALKLDVVPIQTLFIVSKAKMLAMSGKAYSRLLRLSKMAVVGRLVMVKISRYGMTIRFFGRMATKSLLLPISKLMSLRFVIS